MSTTQPELISGRGFLSTNPELIGLAAPELDTQLLGQRLELEHRRALLSALLDSLRNRWTVVVGNLELMASSQPNGRNGERDRVAHAQEAARAGVDTLGRCEATLPVRQLQLQEINASALVERLFEVIRQAVPANIKLVYKLHDDLPKISLDALLVSQVLFDLVRNAATAIGGSDGTVSVVTGHLAAAPDCRQAHYLRRYRFEGPCVYLSVIDTRECDDATDLCGDFSYYLHTPYDFSIDGGLRPDLRLSLCLAPTAGGRPRATLLLPAAGHPLRRY